MPDDPLDGLAGTLYAEADALEALARRIRAQSVVLRHAHERAEDRISRTGPAYVAPMTLEAATSHEPKCDVCHGPKSQCMGVHPEGRWPSC